jgi:hypothetical protein
MRGSIPNALMLDLKLAGEIGYKISLFLKIGN